MRTPRKMITAVSEAAALIADAYPYDEFLLITRKGDGIKDSILMARDMPRPGRRCTHIDSGTEWFVTAEALDCVGFLGLIPLDGK